MIVVVNCTGTVFDKDLGAKTDEVARRMGEFDSDLA